MCIHAIIILPHEHKWQSISAFCLFLTVLELMAGLSTSEAQQALTLLADTALSRQQELLQYSADPANDTDDDNDSDSPIMDTFYNSGGQRAIVKMTNFNAKEFRFIYSKIEGLVSENWNVGKGRRTQYKPKDVLLMTLVMLKHGGQWEFLGQTFKIKGANYERLIMRFVNLVLLDLYEVLVLEKAERWTIARLVEEKRTFGNFPYPRYATDVTFQQANRPSGSVAERKKYYRRKHTLYGFKVEVSVSPTGIAAQCREHFPGSVSDIDIMYRNRAFHATALQKVQEEDAIADVGILSDQYESAWDVLGDKGYQGTAEFVRIVHPKKKPPKGMLGLEDESFNRKVCRSHHS